MEYHDIVENASERAPDPSKKLLNVSQAVQAQLERLYLAYIEIAIHGGSFCISAREAFTLIVTNALRWATINSLGGFILFLSKLGIVAVTVFMGYECMVTEKEGLTYVRVPLVVVGVGCYCVAHCFISVYEVRMIP